MKEKSYIEELAVHVSAYAFGGPGKIYPQWMDELQTVVTDKETANAGWLEGLRWVLDGDITALKSGSTDINLQLTAEAVINYFDAVFCLEDRRIERSFYTDGDVIETVIAAAVKGKDIKPLRKASA